MKKLLKFTVLLFFSFYKFIFSQTIQENLACQPEVYFNILDANGAFYEIVAERYNNEPIFDGYNRLTENYNVARDDVYAQSYIWTQHIGFDHIVDPNAGCKNEILGFGNYIIRIYRQEAQSFQLYFNVRHCMTSFQDLKFEVYGDNSSGIYLVKLYYYRYENGQWVQYIENISNGSVVNYWEKIGTTQNLSCFFNSPESITNNLIIPNENYNNILGNITVGSGKTLTVQGGSQLRFGNGVSLIINGTLNTVGNAYSRITFTRSGTSGVWGGIQFNSGSSGNINYSNISYASYGIYANQTNSITISNSEISYCSGHGIYLYNNYNYQPIISNCNIHSNSTSSGIVMYYSSPVITGCNIYNNYNGLGIADLSDPQFGGYNVPGNNNIHNNSNIGIYTLRYSSPMLGINSNPSQGGNNIVASNSFREAQAETYCYSFAENNWWGSNPPNSSKITAFSGSVIDYDPWLLSQPSLSLMPPGTLAEWENAGITLQASLNESDNHPEIINANIEQAENDKEIAYSIYQLKQLWYQARVSDINMFKNYLRELSEKKEKKHLSAIAKLILSGYEKEKKVSMLDEIIVEYDDQPIVETALMNKFLFYFNELKDYDKAINVMDYIGLKYPDSPVYAEAKDHFRVLNLSNGFEKEETKIILSNQKKVAASDEIYLGDNYPNPFNPTTTIRYQIPQDQFITLKVYDMLGREVADLVNENKKAGDYTINFDGSRLSSGVYIYKLVGINVNLSKKMILMK